MPEIAFPTVLTLEDSIYSIKWFNYHWLCVGHYHGSISLYHVSTSSAQRDADLNPPQTCIQMTPVSILFPGHGHVGFLDAHKGIPANQTVDESCPWFFAALDTSGCLAFYTRDYKQSCTHPRDLSRDSNTPRWIPSYTTYIHSVEPVGLGIINDCCVCIATVRDGMYIVALGSGVLQCILPPFECGIVSFCMLSLPQKTHKSHHARILVQLSNTEVWEFVAGHMTPPTVSLDSISWKDLEVAQQFILSINFKWRRCHGDYHISSPECLAETQAVPHDSPHHIIALKIPNVYTLGDTFIFLVPENFPELDASNSFPLHLRQIQPDHRMKVMQNVEAPAIRFLVDRNTVLLLNQVDHSAPHLSLFYGFGGRDTNKSSMQSEIRVDPSVNDLCSLELGEALMDFTITGHINASKESEASSNPSNIILAYVHHDRLFELHIVPGWCVN